MAQTEKKGETSRHIGVFLRDSTFYNTTLYTYSDPGPTTDTILYELQENDTVDLYLSLVDDFGLYGEGFDFDVQLEYGTPVFINGTDFEAAYTYAYFIDSALVTFCVNGDGIRTHMVKLTKKATAPAQIEEVPTAPPFAVYPNPSGDVLQIQSEEGCRFVIYNAEGKVVTEIAADDPKTIDLTRFESGVYRISQVKEGTVLQTLTFVRM